MREQLVVLARAAVVDALGGARGLDRARGLEVVGGAHDQKVGRGQVWFASVLPRTPCSCAVDCKTYVSCTRRLIQVGGMMAAWGIETPEQAEELMRELTSAENKGGRRYLLGVLKARRTDRWPER